MAPVPTDRDRWVALGLLVAAIALAYFVLLHPWWTVPMIDTETRIDAAAGPGHPRRCDRFQHQARGGRRCAARNDHHAG